jgi:hypothetical protein
MAVGTKFTTYLAVLLRNLANVYKHFEKCYCLHFRGKLFYLKYGGGDFLYFMVIHTLSTFLLNSRWLLGIIIYFYVVVVSAISP